MKVWCFRCEMGIITYENGSVVPVVTGSKQETTLTNLPIFCGCVFHHPLCCQQYQNKSNTAMMQEENATGASGGAGGGGARSSHNAVRMFFVRASQTHQALLDRCTPHVKARWAFAVGLIVVFLLRVLLSHGWYIITYGLGIYHLNLFIAFLTPKMDPAMDLDSELYRVLQLQTGNAN